MFQSSQYNDKGGRGAPGDAQRGCSDADGPAQVCGLQPEPCLYFVTKLDGLIYFFNSRHAFILFKKLFNVDYNEYMFINNVRSIK